MKRKNLPDIETVSIKTCKDKWDIKPRTIYRDIKACRIKRYGTRTRVLLSKREVLERYVYGHTSDIPA